MAQIKKVQKTKFQCKFCSREFAKEGTLSTHPCPARDRYDYRDTRVFKQALGIFLDYYKHTNLKLSKKQEPIMSFVKSSFFMEFVQFSAYYIDSYIINKEYFIDFLFKENIPIHDWCSTKTYKLWVQRSTREEDITSAVIRSVEAMMEWQSITTHPWNTFFERVSPERATHWFETGKLSPWIITLLPVNIQNKLLSRYPASDLLYLNTIIDRTYFTMLAVRKSTEVSSLKEMLKEYNF